MASIAAEALAARIKAAHHIVVLTGAGVSAESGVPTFRDRQTGLWAKYRPEDLATPEAFRRDPETVWRWYEWRRSILEEIKPNPGHFAIAELEALPREFALITQNVDGLHAVAGSRNIIELHGNIGRTICSVERCVVSSWTLAGSAPPKCPNCGAHLRPDVVWFGESLPERPFIEAQDHADRCDLFLSVGTSTVVQPAASLPFMAKRSGAFVVEINVDLTPLSHVADLVVREKSGFFLPSVLELLK